VPIRDALAGFAGFPLLESRNPLSAAPGPPRPLGRDDSWNPALETHEAWSRRRILEAQRYRRARLRRIDYYVSDKAAKIIDAQRHQGPGGDASSILDRIVGEWAAPSGIKYR
jgi:hypothetical protein